MNIIFKKKDAHILRTNQRSDFYDEYIFIHSRFISTSHINRMQMTATGIRNI